MDRFVGLDFGTTNSALAVADADGATLARFPLADGGSTSTFRSVLYFDPQVRDGAGAIGTFAGPEAIHRYLVGDGSGRLIQSVKSYLASGLFQGTSVSGRTYALEDLVSVILRELRAGAERDLGPLGRSAVVGRPVRFSNMESAADEALALARMRTALGRAGFDDVVFEYEPVGAAHFYESGLDHDELVMIGDFGGGTSDFCLMRVGPTARRGDTPRILGTEGVGLAGDAFDSELVERVVSPRLGMGGSYRSYLDGKVIAIPPWIFQKLRRWHHLSFLKSRDTLRFLQDIRSQAIEPARIDALLHLVEYDLGFQLYRVVEGAKVALSSHEATDLTFIDPPVDVRETIPRAAFESWISAELSAIHGCVDRLLTATGVSAGDVDRVFLTGGSSLVPAVRAIFTRRFGEDRVRAGDALTAVALGLALRARAGDGR